MPMKKPGLLFLCFCLLIHFAATAQVKKGRVKRLFKKSSIVQDHFTGFALYDMEKGKMIYELNSDKYFTPASNTKLFTYYACMNMLGDSIPALQYITRNDTLIIWGTGDPTLLHPDFKKQPIVDFLKKWNGPIVYACGNYAGDFYGSGWQWDDYNAYYQPEISELPVYGNIVRAKNVAGKLQLNPAWFSGVFLSQTDTAEAGFRVRRDILENRFFYAAKALPSKYEQDIPFKTSAWLTASLLQDTLKKTVLVRTGISRPDVVKTLYSVPADTLYRHMLQPSDNFMAEELLLLCSSQKFKTLSTDSAINYAIKNYLNDLPDKPQWADGSGLSRQDMFTPRSMIALLNKIYRKKNNEKLLFSLLPEGGKSGTIRSIYTSEKSPFVWAKTGSLSNVHNQSGYIITRNGHKLVYSFMNNNFFRPTREVRNEMVRIMTYIHDKF